MNLSFILKIIGLYRDNFSRELTILDIAKKAKMNYDTTHRTVNFLVKQKVLNSRKIGPSRVITLNNTPIVWGYLSLFESLHSKNLQELMKKVSKYEKRFS